MPNAVYQVPYPENEPVKGYEQGSPEKAEMKAALKELAGQKIEIPMIDSSLAFFWPDGMMKHTMIGEGVEPGELVALVGQFDILDLVRHKSLLSAATDFVDGHRCVNPLEAHIQRSVDPHSAVIQ